METIALAFILAFTVLPYAVGIILSVFRNSPIPLLVAMLVQRIGFVIFLAVVTRDVIAESTLSGVSMLGGFLLTAATSSLVLKPMMDIILAHLVAKRDKKNQ